MSKMPFSDPWQRQLVVLLLRDNALTDAVADHLEASFFESEICKWLWTEIVSHKTRYGKVPSELVIWERLRKLDARIQASFEPELRGLLLGDISEPDYVRDEILEWIKKNVFAVAFRNARNLYNQQRPIGLIYDSMMAEMTKVEDLKLDRTREIWHCETLGTREHRRRDRIDQSSRVSTGIAELDRLMGGGASRGQFGLWIAASKTGKSALLVNQGVVAVRSHFEPTAHFILEGALEQLQNRYDACFSQEIYEEICRGGFSDSRYSALFQEYGFYKQKLYLRAFTDHWSYSTQDLYQAVRNLRRTKGWRPTVVLVDYADLLREEDKEDEWASNALAYSRLKTFSTRDDGYVVWSAAQAKKPTTRDADLKPTLLKSSDLSGRYDKIKVVDWALSYNATQQERQEGRARVWVEAARDAQGGREIPIFADYTRMVFGDRAKPKHSPSAPPMPGGQQWALWGAWEDPEPN